MIGAVSTTPTPAQVLQANARKPSGTVTTEPVVSDARYISSRIRVDNLADIAILEFLSSETGDVIRQYPTEQQIRGYQRAARLEQQAAEQAADQRREVAAQLTQRVNTPDVAPQGSVEAAAPTPSAPSQQSAPAPQSTGGGQQSSSSAGGGEGGSSIVV